MLAFRGRVDLRFGIAIAPEGRPISEPRLESCNLGLDVRAIRRTLSRLSHGRCQAEQKHRAANSCSYHEMPSLDYAPIVSLNLQFAFFSIFNFQWFIARLSVHNCKLKI